MVLSALCPRLTALPSLERLVELGKESELGWAADIPRCGFWGPWVGGSNQGCPGVRNPCKLQSTWTSGSTCLWYQGRTRYRYLSVYLTLAVLAVLAVLGPLRTTLFSRQSPA